MRGNAWRCLIRGRQRAVLGVAALLPFLFTISFFCDSPSFAQAEQEITEPRLRAIFPLGGRRGTTVQAEVWGNMLEGSYAVWCDAVSLSGKLISVEEVKGQAKEHRILLEQETGEAGGTLSRPDRDRDPADSHLGDTVSAADRPSRDFGYCSLSGNRRNGSAGDDVTSSNF